MSLQKASSKFSFDAFLASTNLSRLADRLSSFVSVLLVGISVLGNSSGTGFGLGSGFVLRFKFLGSSTV